MFVDEAPVRPMFKEGADRVDQFRMNELFAQGKTAEEVSFDLQIQLKCVEGFYELWAKNNDVQEPEHEEEDENEDE